MSGDQDSLVLLRAISSNFVDRVLWIISHTIHEITLNYTKEIRLPEDHSFIARPGSLRQLPLPLPPVQLAPRQAARRERGTANN